MRWKQEFSTGYVHIDDQHRSLLEAVEQFREIKQIGGASRSYHAFLGFLTVYAAVHFSLEESCMRAHRCPAASRNCLEHKGFRKMIEAEWQRFDSFGFEPERADALLARIDRWISKHVGQVDVQLRHAAVS